MTAEGTPHPVREVLVTPWISHPTQEPPSPSAPLRGAIISCLAFCPRPPWSLFVEVSHLPYSPRAHQGHVLGHFRFS